MKRRLNLGAIVIVCLLAESAFCQEPLVYPSKGQSQKQMDKDKYQCYGWAKQQTGFDPMQAQAPAAAAKAPQSSAIRGSSWRSSDRSRRRCYSRQRRKGSSHRGCNRGVFSGLKMRREMKEENQAQQAQAQSQNQLRSSYNRAFGVCMRGRGYSTD